MKPEVKELIQDLTTLSPRASVALSPEKLDPSERIEAIRKWQLLTSPQMVNVLLARIEQLEKLWTEPSKEMVNAGIGEVQRILEEWESDHLGWCVDDVTDDQASDMAVFTLQAMASKLPKEPD
ncbi:hypothetical protein ACUND2_22615 [Serratia sp. IR-2025]